VQLLDGVLRVSLLGSFFMAWESQPVREIISPRLQALLAYLLLNRHVPLSRRQVAFQFWPDSSEAQAFANFRNLLTQLRRALPETGRFLCVDGLTVQWNSSSQFWLDVDAFERSLSEDDLEGAACLYAGNLLPDCYDDWIVPERERLAQEYSRVMEALIRTREEARDYEEAIRWAQSYLQHDPIKERTYSHLMRLHALTGSRDEAVRVYYQCAEILQRELGVEPCAGTQKLFEQLLRTGSRTELHVGRKKNPPLVGRSSEWQQLLQRWLSSAAGSPGMALIVGEAGIGKTRLLEEFLGWAERQGITTAYARCYSPQDQLAYAPASEWLRSPQIRGNLDLLDDVWLSEVSRLLPEVSIQYPEITRPGPIKEGWQWVRLFEALTRAVFAAPLPLLLVMDDLQWADQTTLTWLSYLVRFDACAQLLIVGAARPEEPGVSPILSKLRLDLHRDGLLLEFDLQPLDRAESLELVVSICERNCSQEEIEEIYIQAEGNPLFIVETVHSRAEGSCGSKLPDTVGVFNRSWVISNKVEAVIASRLSDLSGCAQALAALAAAGGRQINIEVLFEAWKSSEEEFVAGLDELLRRRIVREQGDGDYDFTHDKIREAVYQRLSQAHRRLLHRSLANALETVHAGYIEAVSGEVAAHYQKGGLERLALPYFLMAGERAFRLYANQEAVSLLRCGQALLASTPVDPDQNSIQLATSFSLLDLLGDVLERVGEHQEAREAYGMIFDVCPGLDSMRLAQTYRKMGETWLAHQDYDSMLRCFDEGERALEPFRKYDLAAMDASDLEDGYMEWLNIAISRIRVYYYQGETDKIQTLSEEILPAVRAHGTPLQKADLYAYMANMVLRRERFVITGEAIYYQRLAIEAALETGEEALIGFSYFNLGFGYLWAGMLLEAEENFLQGNAIAEKTGDESTLVMSLTYLSVLYRKMGKVETARAVIARSLEQATRGERVMYTGMATANQAWLAWRDSNYTQVRMLGESALEQWSRIPIKYPFYWTALWPLIGVALMEDDLIDGVQHAKKLLSLDQQPPPRILAEMLEKSIQCWQERRPEAARLHLHEALSLAREMGYL
jgi:DNA-binding SARP family transcriptional activator